MRGLMMDYPLTLTALLGHTERAHRQREIVSRHADRTIERSTYGDCLASARRLGTALRRLGLRPGDRVATFCWNHRRHLETYFGVPASGFVLHTLNIRLFPEQLAFVINHAQDKLIIVDAAQATVDFPAGVLLDVDFFAATSLRLLHDVALSTHGLSIADELELARTLAMLPRRVRLVAATVEEVTLGRPLTPTTRRLIRTAVRRVAGLARLASRDVEGGCHA